MYANFFVLGSVPARISFCKYFHFGKCEPILAYISAPNVVETPAQEGKDVEQPNGGPSLSWWFTRENKWFSGHDITDSCFGFEESMAVINSTFESQGPFDGILGFSQGACLASVICDLKENNEFKHDFSFVILISGFPSGCSQHKNLHKTKIRINSLHVMGETDKIIPKEMSLALAERFDDPEIMSHPGGHFVSLSGPCKHKFLEYFNKMLNDNLD